MRLVLLSLSLLFLSSPLWASPASIPVGHLNYEKKQEYKLAEGNIEFPPKTNAARLYSELPNPSVFIHQTGAGEGRVLIFDERGRLRYFSRKSIGYRAASLTELEVTPEQRRQWQFANPNSSWFEFVEKHEEGTLEVSFLGIRTSLGGSPKTSNARKQSMEAIVKEPVSAKEFAESFVSTFSRFGRASFDPSESWNGPAGANLDTNVSRPFRDRPIVDDFRRAEQAARFRGEGN